MRLVVAALMAVASVALAHGIDGRGLRVLDGRLVDRAGREVTLRVQPSPVARHVVGGVEAQAAEHVGGALGAFLR